VAERSADPPAPTPGHRLDASPASGPVGLPTALTPLVGRERLLTALGVLLRREDVRLVTLSGPGGVGKTRVALAAAHRLLPNFPDGITFVELAAVSDSRLVLAAIGRALGLRESGGRDIEAVLTGALRGRRLLLVLDNFEHLLPAAPSVTGLLASCPGVKALVTSRIVLRLTGEWDQPVPSLALPDPECRTAADGLAAASVELFVARAQAADPVFTLDEITLATVVAICRQLDGLPLALELAAARLRHLPLGALLTHLDPRLPLLTGGPRDLPARLQTIHAAITWSFDLLGPTEQALFRQLCVFVGGFTVEAAARVAGAGDDLAVLEGTAALVDHSLIRRASDAADSRYSMLEVIREFGLAHLTASGEDDAIRQRHATWCSDLVDEAWPAFARRTGQEPWLDRITSEHDNIRAALDWLQASNRIAQLAHLAGRLFWFWFVRGHLSEGRDRLDRVRHSAGFEQAEPEDRALVRLGAGLLAHFQGDETESAQLVEEAWRLSRSAGFTFGEAAAPLTLGIIAEDRGRYDEAIPCYEEALAACRRIGDPVNEALARYHLGVAAWGQGDLDEAVGRIEEALTIQRATGDQWGIANSLGYLGLLLVITGQHERAAAALRESLNLRRLLGTPVDLANSLAAFAVLAVATDEPAIAARLLGAEQMLREEVSAERKLPERAAFEEADVRATQLLGEDGFAALVAEGRALRRDAAIALALGFTPDAQPAPQPVAGRHERLTEREREVLALLTLGKTNPAIAAELFVGLGTVRTHVSNILGKLGARTRTEAADIARRRGLV
jgi:predicted ATPase/DNA-binding CsgD family transcriptional regulator